MIGPSFTDGRYTLGHLARTLAVRGPSLIAHLPEAVANVRGPDKLPGRLGVPIYLRMARLMGCPVCAALFPRAARARGFTEAQIEEAFSGLGGDLDEETRAALRYAEAVLRADGERPPGAPPEPLGPRGADQVATFVRTSMIIHAVGLLFVPHLLVERTRRGAGLLF